MKLSEGHSRVLRNLARKRIDPATNRVLHVDIRQVSEPFRQKAIDLAMMEPALVDIEADRLFVTDAGRKALEDTRK